MARTQARPAARSTILVASVLVAVILICGSSPASAEPSRRLLREIRLTEDLLSDVLIESPYWLVSSGAPNQGIYIEDLGVIFSMEASLVSGSHWSSDNRGLRVLSRLGKHFVFWDEDDDYWDDDVWDDDDDDWDDEDEDEDDDAYRRLRSRRTERSTRCYERGKRELREALVDSGEMLDELADDNWVIFATSLDDHRYFRRNDLTHLLIKVRMGDLRAFHDGRLDAEQLKTRIVEEEY